MCGLERARREREKRKDARVCMFWNTSINRRATTDGRHTRYPLPFYNSFFKLFVYQPVCSLCVFVMSAFLCVLVSLHILYALACMAVHDHVHVVYAHTCLWVCSCMCLIVGCLTLPAACPGPQRTIRLFSQTEPDQEGKHSREPLSLPPYPSPP